MRGFAKPNAKDTQEFERGVRRLEGQVVRKWRRGCGWIGDDHIWLIEAHGVTIPIIRAVRDRLAANHPDHKFSVSNGSAVVRGVIIEPIE